MTALSETPRPQATLAMTHAYEEAPGVKKLYKGQFFPKGFTSGIVSLLIGAVVIALLCAGVAGIILYAATVFLNMDIGWMYVGATLVGTTVLRQFAKQPISWALHAPNSPLAISRKRRANLNKARLIAHQLGADVVPVLTVEHIKAIQTVHEELEAASGDEAADRASDHDRLAVLLLEDLNREHLLLDLIKGRGITNMDDIEATLKEIEESTIAPLQSGWL